MRTRSAVGVLLAVLLAGSALVMAAPAQALTNSPLDCDGVVAVPGGYLLTRDTDCTITWNESDKSFDLDGHTFTGQLRMLGGSNLKVHDGTLLISGSDAWMSADATFSHVRIRPAADRVPAFFFIQVGLRFTLEHSVVEDVPGAAFDVFDGADGVRIRHSVFRNNRLPITIQQGNDALIEGNWFVDNETGVQLFPEDGSGVNGNVIRRNVFVANGTTVNLAAPCDSLCQFLGGREPALDNTRIEHNLIMKSGGSGIAISKRCEGTVCLSTAGNLIRGNLVTGSGHDPAAASFDDGITARGTSRAGNVETPYPQALAGFTLSGNLAVHNADLGFDVFGVTDGGRNLAFANGNRNQCDGVRCSLWRSPHRASAAAPALGGPLLQLHADSEPATS